MAQNVADEVGSKTLSESGWHTYSRMNHLLEQRTINGIQRISTPGRRVFAGRDEIPRVLGGMGIAILSTSQGLITDRQAKKRGIGGEVLAHVW